MTSQRINLLHDALLPTKEHATFHELRILLSALVLLLGAYSILQAIDLAGLREERRLLADQVKNLRTVGDRLRSLGVEQESPVLRSEVEALQAVSRAQAKIASLLAARSGDDKPRGFAAQLNELAQHTLPGVQLTQIDLDATNSSAALYGRALDPALVPALVKALAQGERFDGYRFAVFQLETGTEGMHNFAIVGPNSETSGEE